MINQHPYVCTYLAKPCAPSSLSPSQDSTLSKKLEEIEQRLQQSAAESHQRRQMENQKL
jgi:tetrahydromethanopterin S-methyltransferase subunit G